MVCFSKQLRTGLSLWETIATDSVVDWVKNGIKLPFHSDIPEGLYFHNKLTSRANSDFITHELDDLLKQDVIEEVSQVPTCVSPISAVPKKNGKF
jgi:hypothetical protein